ncbi:hypothetical protein [Adlercreutzia sp. ZJ304]|uniref:hypothetical protein n=1 Tax=Adlercreutzia sp. ZJ304 TaxID=2709791 RepID=UPI0013ED4B27|nr:hypothetical protein [Adlercreutzia sp. ZJ304]
MKKTSILKRATSIACAAAMALTMTPFAAGAFGSDQSKAYAANDPVPQVGANVCMTVPLFVTFGGEEGYDVSNPASSITSDFSLVNSGKTNAYVSQIVSKDLGATKLFYKMNGTEGKPAVGAEDPLFSLYLTEDESQRIDFGPGDATTGSTVEKGAGVYIGANRNSTAQCTFRLNLTNTDQVKDAKYAVNTDNLVVAGTTPGEGKYNYDVVNKLAQLTVTITGTGYPLFDYSWVSGSYNGKNAAQLEAENVPMYLIDNEYNQVYSLDDIKKQVADIKSKGEKSPYCTHYRDLAIDPSRYTCKIQFGTGNNYEEVVVLDSYVDSMEDPAAIDETQTKDNIVFQFKRAIGNTPIQDTNKRSFSVHSKKDPSKVLSGNMYGFFRPIEKEASYTDADYAELLRYFTSLETYLHNNLKTEIPLHTNSLEMHDQSNGISYFYDVCSNVTSNVMLMDSPNAAGLWTRLFAISASRMCGSSQDLYRYYQYDQRNRMCAVGGFGVPASYAGVSCDYITGDYGGAGNTFHINGNGNRTGHSHWSDPYPVRPGFAL